MPGASELNLRPFEHQDLKRLVDLLNEAEKGLRDFRPYSEEDIELNYLKDTSFDPSGLILAWLDGRLAGAALAQVDQLYVSVRGEDRGFVRWIRTEPGDDKVRLQDTLLQTSIEYLVRRHMREALTSIPSHNTSDIEFYGSNGFFPIRKFNYMESSLKGELHSSSLPTGYSWAHYQRGEEAEWVGILNSAFKEHWGKRPTTIEEFRRWSEESTFDSTGVIGIRMSERLVGIIYCEIDPAFIEYTGKRRAMLWIIGVIPEERGIGLGKALTIAGMNWSQKKEMEIAALYVDAENVPAVGLYRQLGFKTQYEVHHLLKKLE